MAPEHMASVLSNTHPWSGCPTDSKRVRYDQNQSQLHVEAYYIRTVKVAVILRLSKVLNVS